MNDEKLTKELLKAVLDQRVVVADRVNNCTETADTALNNLQQTQ